MTEYWKSQARKFCDFCKCWLSDNKASIEFHESGKRHQQAVENRLQEISRKGAHDERKAKKQEEWIEKMNAAAMKDYRHKDLEGANPDLTANIFHHARAQRDVERASQQQEKEVIADKARKAAAKAGFNTAGPSTSKDPMLECIPDRVVERSPPPEEDRGGGGTTGGGEDGESQVKLRRMEAPKEGTKWHNPPDAKKWFEAKTDDGTIYFWHVETQESRWTAPPEGFLSIKDQEEINRKHEERELKKYNKIVEQQSIHNHQAAYSVTAATEAVAGPAPKAADPYGGWQKVAKKSDVIDFQAVQQDEEPAGAGITLHDDRIKKFETKKTPKLGDDFEADLSAGIVSSVKRDFHKRPAAPSAQQQPSKPAIVFRKRKANPDRSTRKPGEADE